MIYKLKVVGRHLPAIRHTAHQTDDTECIAHATPLYETCQLFYCKIHEVHVFQSQCLAHILHSDSLAEAQVLLRETNV
jgi:hypothetical protein